MRTFAAMEVLICAVQYQGELPRHMFSAPLQRIHCYTLGILSLFNEVLVADVGLLSHACRPVYALCSRLRHHAGQYLSFVQ